MSANEKATGMEKYKSYQFGDTEFLVPFRYQELSARGFGAQGAVW